MWCKPTHPPGSQTHLCFAWWSAASVQQLYRSKQLAATTLPSQLLLSNFTRCAKLTPPLTMSRAWKAASHFLHFFVVDTKWGVSVTFTFLSAKCQPHHVSKWAMLMFHEAFLTLWDILPDRPDDKVVLVDLFWLGIFTSWNLTAGSFAVGCLFKGNFGAMLRC